MPEHDDQTHGNVLSGYGGWTKEKAWHACGSVIEGQMLVHCWSVQVHADAVVASQLCCAACRAQTVSTAVKAKTHPGRGMQPATLAQRSA